MKHLTSATLVLMFAVFSSGSAHADPAAASPFRTGGDGGYLGRLSKRIVVADQSYCRNNQTACQIVRNGRVVGMACCTTGCADSGCR